MKWHFPRQPKNQVETEITQRDQFDNDEVQLSETIVREAIQNSLDAAVDDTGTVRVRFAFLDNSHGLSSDFMSDLLDGHDVHAKASGLDTQQYNPENPTALVIEDFGTVGLTGSISEKDDKNFSDFWRRHGKSHKSGKSRGRWGLGKLVYSCTSQAGVFFGLTVRNGDIGQYLMGQTVLNLHTVDGIDYTPHAFFGDLDNEGDPLEEISVPIGDSDFVQKFVDHFSLQRGNQTGLSIAIPYPNNLNSQRMIGITIQNYFYPIITKKLTVEINHISIDSTNIRELAHRYAKEHFADIDTLFDFIEEASSMDHSKLLKMNDTWSENQKLDEDDFEPEVLDEIREKFSNGDLVSIFMPITLTKKNGQVLPTSFSIFLKRPHDLEKGLDLYVRGGLTLPSETKFKERRSLGVLVAEEEAICAFLGDAENAAHTQWTTNTEKLRKNYISPQKNITMIKKALIQLYDLLAEVTEERDEDALNKFFWFQEPDKPQKAKKRQKPTPPINPVITNQKKPKLSITRVKGGLIIQKGEGLEDKDIPRKVSVKLAYEVSRGNAFKKWKPFDFDVGKKIKITSTNGANILSSGGQDVSFEITNPYFYLEISGFDTNRDLKVKVV